MRASREAALEGATQERLGEAVTFGGGKGEEEEEAVDDVMLPGRGASRR